MLHVGESKLRFSRVVRGRDVLLGDGYRARRFEHDDFGGKMAPVRSIEHFLQTEKTSPSCALAGLSMLTLLLEDSSGELLCNDDTGRSRRVKPGDAHWFIAGTGAVCRDDLSAAGRRVHALRMLIDSPSALKAMAPQAVYLESTRFKRSNRPPARVKVLDFEEMADLKGPGKSQALSITDVALDPRTGQSFASHAGRNTTLLVIAGVVRVVDPVAPSNHVVVRYGEAISFASEPGAPYPWRMHTSDGARVLIVSGLPVSGSHDACGKTWAGLMDTATSQVGG